MARLILATHRIASIVVYPEVEKRWRIRPINCGVAVKRIHNPRHRTPRITAGVRGELFHIHKRGHRNRTARLRGRVMNQTVTVLHPVNHIGGLPRHRIKILQSYIEAPLRGRRIRADAPHGECVPMRIPHTKVIDQHPQRQTFDIYDLGILSRRVQPCRVVVAQVTIPRKIDTAHPVVTSISGNEEIIHHPKRIMHRVHSLKPKVAHKALVKRVRQIRIIPPEKMLELLRATQVIRDIEVSGTRGNLRRQHRPDHHEPTRRLHPNEQQCAHH